MGARTQASERAREEVDGLSAALRVFVLCRASFFRLAGISSSFELFA